FARQVKYKYSGAVLPRWVATSRIALQNRVDYRMHTWRRLQCHVTRVRTAKAGDDVGAPNVNGFSESARSHNSDEAVVVSSSAGSGPRAGTHGGIDCAKNSIGA